VGRRQEDGTTVAAIRKQLIVVGDRILVRPERGEQRTQAGLYLPATVASEQPVRGGRVVGVGPGLPVPEPADYDEPWKKKPSEPRYVPLQAKVGDYALFLKNAAVEINFEREHFLIVPNGAVLVLVREEISLPDGLGEKFQGLAELDASGGSLDEPGLGSPPASGRD
jgi:chaperonin GroES